MNRSTHLVCYSCHPFAKSSSYVTLVVESRVRKKRSKGGRDVFQFVQTVEKTVWEDKQLQETLQVSYVLTLVASAFHRSSIIPAEPNIEIVAKPR